jgi:hypothetical protein
LILLWHVIEELKVNSLVHLMEKMEQLYELKRSLKKKVQLVKEEQLELVMKVQLVRLTCVDIHTGNKDTDIHTGSAFVSSVSSEPKD